MHSSVAESSFNCWLQFFFSGKTGVSLFKKRGRFKKKNVLLLFVRYAILKGVM